MRWQSTGFWGLALALSASGCASYGTAMINPNRQIVTCRATGGGALGVAMASSSHDKCVETYRTAGYLLVDEAGATGISNVSSEDKTVRILKVTENSPASRTGITAGDVIRKVNGQPVTTARDAMTLLFGRAGEKVDLVLAKDREERAVTLTLDPYRKIYGTGK